MPEHPLTGLFYPYANPTSLGTLNNALLVFDRIAVIDPEASFCRQELPSTGRVDRALLASVDLQSLRWQMEQYVLTARTLLAEGVLETIDPRETFDDFGGLLEQAVRSDIEDQRFIEHCQTYGALSWLISMAKLPGASDLVLRDLLVNIPREPNELLRRVLGKGVQALDLTLAEDPCASEGQLPIFPLATSKRQGNWGAISHGSGVASRSLLVPFPIGESIMLTHALAACATRKLIPFTDERFHFDALSIKAQRAAMDNRFTGFLTDVHGLHEVKSLTLARRVAFEALPSLESVPVDKILEFRRRHADLNESYRAEMRSLAWAIEGTPWTTDLEAQILKIIDTKVNPALRQIRSTLGSSRAKLWGSVARAVAHAAPVPILGALWPGLPAEVAVGIGVGAAGLQLLADKLSEASPSGSNGFLLLLEADKLVRSHG